MKKVIIASIIVLIFSLVIVQFIWFDNMKLNLTRYWWFFTIQNNPLLSEYDKDLQSSWKEIYESRVYLSELLSWWPWKDWIPSIDDPVFVSADNTKFNDEQLIVWVYLNWEARVYPYWILNWHEIVNDKIWDTPITVTLCPLCDTNPVFIRKLDWIETTFWVSWKLFQSCLIMYDRLTDTLWSQPWGLWIVWKNVNKSLEKIPSVKTTLWKWKEKYPNTKVLSIETWHNRDYFKYPYWDYYTNKTIIFPVRNQDKLKIHPKEIESYIWQFDNSIPKNIFSWESFHITHKEIKELKKMEIDYLWKKINILWDEKLETVKFMEWNEIIPSSTSFGFVYRAFFK